MRDAPETFIGKGKTLAVVGLGLMGGSLALAVRQRMPDVRIAGWARREEAIQQALKSGMIHMGSTDPEEVLPEADFTVLCLPLDATVQFARDHAGVWREGVVVTDVGSVKTRIVEEVSPCLEEQGIAFVGSHPMAGSERFGLKNATADLYENAAVMVTPSVHEQDEPQSAAVTRTKAFWEAVGCRVFFFSADEHDKMVAGTSHAVHLLAGMAVNAFLSEPGSSQAAGGGFRDFTRIASSSPQMWTRISEYNDDRILRALDCFSAQLQQVRAYITNGQWQDLENYLNAGRARRERWLEEWNKTRSGEESE